jgi:(S)-ureidoglycine aminohydrolase
MHQLGQTRSAHKADHLLHTPDAFVRAPLPGMRNATAVVHVAPAAGALFVQYTAEFEDGGELGASLGQRFIYVLEGSLAIDGQQLLAGGFIYLPAGQAPRIVARETARAAVIEKPYEPLPGGRAPGVLVGDERDASVSFLNGDPWLEVRSLIPDDAAFDFRVNTMTYQPGASLAMVEVHVMEHGLLMLEGSGIYRLGDSWYSVAAGDFIWMAPFCPQWFGAIGKIPAKYLIYKDWDRHPLAVSEAEGV